MPRHVFPFLVLFTTLQNIYAQFYPIYWEGKIGTQDNGTSTSKVPIFMQATVNQYMSVNNTKQKRVIDDLKRHAGSSTTRTLTEQYLPDNEPPEDINGTVRTVKFANGIFTDLIVMNQFNYNGEGTTPVRFSSSWYKIVEDESHEHSNDFLAEAVKEGNLLSIHVGMAYSIGVEDSKVNEGKKFEIDKYLCYYGGQITYFVEDRCYIDYVHWMDYMRSMWDPSKVTPEALNAELSSVTNDGRLYNRSIWCVNNTDTTIEFLYMLATGQWKYICEFIENNYLNLKLVDEEDAFFPDNLVYFQVDSKPVGLGHVTNFTFGINKTVLTHDVNFTVEFSDWTSDFPHGMIDSFKDITFDYSKFTMYIKYWTANPVPKPERGLPNGFWLMIILLASATFIILFSVCMLSLTCSKRTFELNIWEYRQKRKSLKLTREIMKEEKLQAQLKISEDMKYMAYQEEYVRMQTDLEDPEKQQQPQQENKHIHWHHTDPHFNFGFMANHE